MSFAIVDAFKKTVWNQSTLLAINFIKIDLDLISLSQPREEGVSLCSKTKTKGKKTGEGGEAERERGANRLKEDRTGYTHLV